MIIAVVRYAEIMEVTEKSQNGLFLPSVPAKHLRINLDDADDSGPAENVTVSEAGPLVGRYDRRPGTLLLLAFSAEEVTHEFVVTKEEISGCEKWLTRLTIGVWSRTFPTISGDIPPLKCLWWNWKHWYSKMVPAARVADAALSFVAECEGALIGRRLSVTEQNRHASRTLYHLARENGYRQVGTKFAAKLGLKAGAWITDEDFHRAGESVYPDWARLGVGEETHRAACGVLEER